MIQYSMRCRACEAVFSSWFESMAAYDKLARKKALCCPQCASKKIEKSPMAPAVLSGKGVRPVLKAKGADGKMLKKLKKMISDNFENVGGDFAEEARAMHYGEKAERAIYGETSVSEAEELLEEGVEIISLPVAIEKKTN
ncbi:MAG: DUF1178 family protein [Parvibaculales bacterium]